MVGIVWFGIELIGNLSSPGLSLKDQFSVCRELGDPQAEGSRCEVSYVFMRSGSVKGQVD